MNTKSCLLGAIIGDIAGSVYELYSNRITAQEYFNNKFGFLN